MRFRDRRVEVHRVTGNFSKVRHIQRQLIESLLDPLEGGVAVLQESCKGDQKTIYVLPEMIALYESSLLNFYGNMTSFHVLHYLYLVKIGN